MSNKVYDLDNVYDFHQVDLNLNFTLGLDIEEIPQTKPIQYPDFDFNFVEADIDGLKSISHDGNAVYINLTEAKYVAIGIKASPIFVDVAHEEGDVTQSDLTVSWMPLGASDTDNSHMVRMYHSEIVEVFGSYEDFFKNPTAIIGWVAAHVAKGTPSQW